jgi:hypothetical protein
MRIVGRLDHDECAPWCNRETELLQIIRELLAMEELDLGDHSQLPEDHPIARGEKAIGNR